MKTVFKSKALLFFAILVICFCGFFGMRLHAEKPCVKADEIENPTVTIEANNLSYADSMYILYAVSNNGFDRTEHKIKILLWEEVQEEYAVGTETYAVTSNQSASIKGKNCLVFYSDGLAAKEMTKDIYARAYVEIDGESYYSDVSKFSVLEYVYTMRASGSLTENQQKLFDSMLSYGAAAQEIFSWTTDRLANDTYYKIDLINGKASDGFAHGLYKMGDRITIKADEAPSGEEFLCWKDKDGKIVAEGEETEIQVGDADNEYTAVYQTISIEEEPDESVVDEQGLTYTPNLDGDAYTVTHCDATAMEVVIPSVYNGLPVVRVEEDVFSDCENMTVYCEVEILRDGWNHLDTLSNCAVYWYAENEPAVNEDGTAYDGNFWYYGENGEIVVWIYTPQEETLQPNIPTNAVIVNDKIWRSDGYALKSETDEKAPEEFDTVTEFDWVNNMQGWATTSTALSTSIFDKTTDLSGYSDIYFANKIENGTLKTIGLTEEEWYSGGDWLYVHYQQGDDALWSLASLISLDGYTKTNVQIGIDASALDGFPTLRGLFQEKGTSGLYPIRESATTETVIYMTNVLGVKK